MTALDEKIGDFVGKLLVRVVAKEIAVPRPCRRLTRSWRGSRANCPLTNGRR